MEPKEKCKIKMSIEVHSIFEKGSQVSAAKIPRQNYSAFDIKVVESFICPKYSIAIRSFN